MAGRVFVFFNCDADKNESSMNIFYNDTTFKDTIISRKRLLQKIKTENAEGRIKIEGDNLAKIEEIIMSGDPVEASDLITYGAIKAFKSV